MLGNFLSGLSNLGQIYRGYEQSQDELLRQQYYRQALQQQELQQKAADDIGKLVATGRPFGGPQLQPGAAQPISPPVTPPLSGAPGQVDRQPLAPPPQLAGLGSGPLGLGGIPGGGPLGVPGLPGMSGFGGGSRPPSLPPPAPLQTASAGMGGAMSPFGPGMPFTGVAGGAGEGLPPQPFNYRQASGMIQPGTIQDPWNRAVLQNPDGTYSTTSSIGVGTDAGEAVIPTVVDGKRLSNEEAKQHFRQTGEHFGIFNTEAEAETFATDLHNAQAARLGPQGQSVAQMNVVTFGRPGAARPGGIAQPPGGFGLPPGYTPGQPQVSGTADAGVVGTGAGGRNNPGNIKTVSGGYQTFDTPQQGIAAIGDWGVRAQQNHGLTTVRQLIGRYAPLDDPGNWMTDAQGRRVPKPLVEDAARAMGVGPDDPVDLRDPQTRARWTQAILRQEGAAGPGRINSTYQDMSQNLSPRDNAIGTRGAQALLSAFPQMPQVVSSFQTANQLAQSINQGLPGISDQEKGAVFLKLFPLMSQQAKEDAAEKWKEYDAQVKKLEFGEKTRHEMATEGKLSFGTPENYEITNPDGTKQTVLAREVTDPRTGRMQLVDDQGQPISTTRGSVRKVGTREPGGSAIEQGKSYQYTDEAGVTQQVFLREKRGEAGYLDATTGKDWAPPPGARNFHEITSTSATGLAPEVQFPETWEGMPNKPPPGVRQDIWNATIQYTQTGQMPSLGFQPGVRPQIVALQPAAAHALGIQPSEISGVHAEYRGLTGAQGALGRRLALLTGNINEAIKAAPVVKSSSAAVPRSEFPALNEWTNWLQLQTGDPKIVQFRAALRTFLNEYAKGINPTGVLSDTQQKHAYDTIRDAFNQGQVEAGVNMLLQELQFAKQGLTEASGEIGSYFPRVSGQQPGPGGSAAGGSAVATGVATMNRAQLSRYYEGLKPEERTDEIKAQVNQRLDQLDKEGQ